MDTAYRSTRFNCVCQANQVPPISWLGAWGAGRASSTLSRWPNAYFRLALYYPGKTLVDSTESSAVLCLAEGPAKVTVVLGFQVASSQKVRANFSSLLVESQFLSCELMVNTWVAKFPLSHNYPPLENGPWWMQTVHSNVFADYCVTTLDCIHKLGVLVFFWLYPEQKSTLQ